MRIYLLYKNNSPIIPPQLWEFEATETSKLYHLRNIGHVAGHTTQPGYVQLKKHDSRIYLDKQVGLAAYIEAARKWVEWHREDLSKAEYQLLAAQEMCSND